MSAIEIRPDLIQVDAEVIAKALQLQPRDLRERMRDGTVTSRFERGEGADAGRVRLTFFSDRRRARITADAAGNVLSCSAVDYHRRTKRAQPGTEGAITATADAGRDHLDAMLDDALDGTFPASDPVALSFDERD